MDTFAPPPGFDKWLIAIFAAIISVGGAWSVVTRMLSPFKRLKESDRRLEAELHALKEQIEADLKTHKELLVRDYAALQQTKECDKAIIKALKALLSNAATGNSTGLMKEAERELDRYLIEK